MPVHNKLVRDLIPNIIDGTGKSFTMRILDEEEYVKELRIKSKEELQEYLDAKDDDSAIEELADLLEIIHTLSKVHGTDFNKVEEVRQQKAKNAGALMREYF